MSPGLILLGAGQAALLFWSAVQGSEAYLRPGKLTAVLLAVAGLGPAIALARVAGDWDPRRMLCGPGDCLVLVLCVACVRIIVVSREEEKLLRARALEEAAAAEAAEAARRAYEAERVRAAAAALAAHRARTAAAKSVPLPAARRLAPSLIPGAVTVRGASPSRA